MTFSRAKSAGWTDDVDTVTASQLNTIDVNQSRAIDGTSGGTYTPAGAPIVINGTQGVQFGTDGNAGIAAARVTGKLTMATTGGRFVQRVQTTVADADTLLSVDYDIYRLPAGTAPRTYSIATASAPVPVAGESIRLTRPSASANAFNIRREGSGGNICTFTASQICEADVYFDGTNWRLGMHSPNVTPGADA